MIIKALILKVIGLSFICILATGYNYAQLRITAPMPGDTLLTGETVDIKWEGSANYNVTLYYSSDAGASWNIIAEGIESDSYNWTVPFMTEPDFRLKIKNTEVLPPRLLWIISDAHEDEIRSVSFSKDDKSILSGGLDNKIKIWDIENKEEINSITLTRSLFDTEYLNDETKVAAACDSAVFIWNTEDNSLFEINDGNIKRNAYSLAVNPANDLIAVASFSGKSVPNDGEVRVYNSLSGGFIKEYHFENYDNISKVLFSADGSKIMFTGYGGIIREHDFQTDAVLNNLTGHGNMGQSLLVWSIDMSEDVNYAISGGSDNAMKFWDLNTGEEINSIEEHELYIRSVKFHPVDDVVMSAAQDNYIRQWQFPGGQEVFFPLDHGGQILDADYSSDGSLIVSCGRNNAIKLWENYSYYTDSAMQANEVFHPIKVKIPHMEKYVGEYIYVPLLMETNSYVELPEEPYKILTKIGSPNFHIHFFEYEGELSEDWDTLQFEPETYRYGDTIARFKALVLHTVEDYEDVNLIDFSFEGHERYLIEKEDGSLKTLYDCDWHKGMELTFTGAGQSMEIFPNPSDGRLNIKMNIILSGNYKIRLYDLNGNIIANPINKNLEMGGYEFTACFEGIAPGRYTLSLESENCFISKELLISD